MAFARPSAIAAGGGGAAPKAAWAGSCPCCCRKAGGVNGAVVCGGITSGAFGRPRLEGDATAPPFTGLTVEVGGEVCAAAWTKGTWGAGAGARGATGAWYATCGRSEL